MRFYLDLTDNGKQRLYDAVLNALDNGQCFELVKAIVGVPQDTGGANYDNPPVLQPQTVTTTGAMVRAGDKHNLVAAITVKDVETQQTHVITMSNVYAAWWAITTRQKVNGKHVCHSSYASRIATLGLDPEHADVDSYDSDILLQMAVFKDVIYG